MTETRAVQTLFPTALVLMAYDSRDAWPLEAMAEGAAALGIRRVLLLHVAPTTLLPGPLARFARPVVAPTAALESAREALLARVPGLTVEVRSRVGELREVLRHIVDVEHVDLMVMGRDRFVGGKSAWGPDGLGLLREARCSALVVPNGARFSPAHAVAGVDFSENAADAMVVASKVFGEVEGLYALDRSVVELGSLTDEDFERHADDGLFEHVERDVRPRLPAGAKLKLRVVDARNHADALVAHAEGATIVIGSRGLSPLAALVLGSTAERIAGRANAPVLIVRRDAATRLLEGLTQ